MWQKQFYTYKIDGPFKLHYQKPKITVIIVSVIIITAIVSLIALFIWLQNRDRIRKNKKLIHLFNKTGEEDGLTFSSQEILYNKIIGLDGLNRKFVVVNENGSSQIIDLNEVKSCHVQKKIIGHDSGSQNKETRVAYIQLYFHLEDKRYESVVFYDYMNQRGMEQKKLENKANDWKIILSKLLPEKRCERA